MRLCNEYSAGLYLYAWLFVQSSSQEPLPLETIQVQMETGLSTDIFLFSRLIRETFVINFCPKRNRHHQFLLSHRGRLYSVEARPPL